MLVASPIESALSLTTALEPAIAWMTSCSDAAAALKSSRSLA
jgi:hypothetical protein